MKQDKSYSEVNLYEVIIDGNSLRIEDVIAVAYHPEYVVRLATSTIPFIDRSSTAVDRYVSEGRIAYGITTGFGAFKDRLINKEDVKLLQENILVSHAVGVGNYLDEPTTRAMMLIRANTLAKGYSGIRVETLQLLLALLNKNVLPVIPEKGSLGASGDLAPLAHMALPLIGRGQVIVENKTIPSDQALKKFGLAPVQLSAKEGLALTNGTTLMTALGIICVDLAQILIETANLAAGLSLEAQNGTAAAFADSIHQLRPQPWQRETAKIMRNILDGSQFIRPSSSTNIQDAYTLRCIPQVHGAIRNVLEYVKSILSIELNSVTDNPMIFIGESDDVKILSGGNFHGEPLALALDFLGIAMTDLGNICERRIAKLVDNKMDSQFYPPFLTEFGGLNSGFMLLQYTAAALTSENKTLSHPSSTDSIPSSGNVEDHVSMGPNAALHCKEVLNNLSVIVAIELLCAAQAVDFRLAKEPDLKLGKGTKPAYELIRALAPFIPTDTYLYPYLEELTTVVKKGSFSGLT